METPLNQDKLQRGVEISDWAQEFPDTPLFNVIYLNLLVFVFIMDPHQFLPRQQLFFLGLSIDPHYFLPRQQILFLGSSKMKKVHFVLNITIHSQISQHTVCPQAPTPPLPHIYSTKSMCTCVYSAYVIVCVYACVCAYVCVAPQSPLFHKVFFFTSDSTACISYLMWNRVPCSQGSMQYCAPPHSLFWTWGL